MNFAVNMPFLTCAILYLFSLITVRASSDVLGCGGFIKSHAPIDFAKIEVKLFTKQGSLKDSTFCAPNNGYFFLPVYDKGEYYLRINPPRGWSFMPKEVHLQIDGINDLCSQGKDIDFVFEGFGITGQVDNVGGGPGPKDVKIQLTGHSEVRETTTNDEGTFYFTPVYPGTYVVTATHPKWKFKENKHTVQVASENTALPKNSFLVIGYDVTGTVSFDRQPMGNIYFVLFNDSNQPVIYEGCIKDKLPDFTYEEKYLCYVTSNEQGIFTFPTLSPGSYRLVPFYKKGNMKYHIHPEETRFRVVRNSLMLAQVFEVQSFTISGRVLTNVDGQSVQGATIFINDKPVTTSQANGLFNLEKINSGIYSIHIEAPGLKFEKKSIKVGPNIIVNTNFMPSAFQVCGAVINENSHEVVFKNLDRTSTENRIETNKGIGDFCTYLAPGNYTARVSSTKSHDIQFFPMSQPVQVKSSPVSDVNFSQLKATVRGRVKCLQPVDCTRIHVIMNHISSDGTVQDTDYMAALVDGHYTFSDVVTGTYQVSLGVNKYCWQAAKHTIVVNSETTVVPDFIQTGYTIVFLSSHTAQVQYQPLVNAGEQRKSLKSLQIVTGQNIHCVESPGVYEFIISSCHLYENSVIKHNTNDDSSEIVLAAMKHLSSVEIMSAEQVNNLNISTTISGVTSQIGPLIPKFRDNAYYYKINIHLAEGEEAVLIPQSDVLWFKPISLTIVGEADCVDHGSRIMGMKGRVIQGQVLPPLAGVVITVEGPGNDVLIRETDEQGKYKFPTLDDAHTYKVTAAKKSYTFTGPDERGTFKAHKLAEIIVTAVDQKDDSPLQGALISLSGGDSYRSNMQTNANGVIHFSSLSPSDYFLRPMMKEYNFEPSSKMISIEEGATVNIKLSGHRVAYSAYGMVNSLSGEPEDRMVVVADGTGSCSQYSEEATTEENGQFRIRGLHPHCTYEIHVKDSLDPNYKIERAVPDFIPIQTTNQDISDIRLIALRQIQHMDIIVLIHSSKVEYFRSLRLKLCKENMQNSPIYNVKLDPVMYKITGQSQPGVLVHLPPLALDNKSYFLQLESSLSQTVHNYKTDVEYFVANTSFKYFVMEFNPQSQIQDQDIGHTSALALPFILICLIALYNIQQISKFASETFSKYNLHMFTNAFIKGKSPSVDRMVDNDEIDQIVQNINAVKRKTRPRKI